MEFGLKIKDFRQSKKLSRKAMSDITGISPGYLEEIENGKKNPTIETLYKISSSFGITVSELIGEAEIKINPIYQNLLNAVNHYSDDDLHKLIAHLESTKPHKRLIEFEIDGHKGSYILDTYGKSDEQIVEVIKENLELLRRLYELNKNQ